MAVVALFDEVLLDSAIMTVGTGSPEFANTIVRNPGIGIYKVNVTRFDPIETWLIDLDMLTETEREYAMRFWRGGYGSGYGFRVRVPADWKTQAEVIGTGNGVQTVFNLTKTYTRAGTVGHANIRRITKPAVTTNLTGGSATLFEPDGVTGRIIPHTGPPGTGQAFQVFLNGANQASGWTVLNTQGKVTFSSPPGGGVVVSWSGEFDTPMRFLQNSFSHKVDVASEIHGLQLVEILPAELGIT